MGDWPLNNWDAPPSNHQETRDPSRSSRTSGQCGQAYLGHTHTSTWYRNPTKQLEEKSSTVMELTIGPIGTSTMDICGILIEHDGNGTELPRICAGADENSQREMPEVYQVGKLDMARKSCFEIWPWSWGSSGISGKASIHAHPIISHDLDIKLTLVVDPTREVNQNKQLGLWCPCVLMTFVLTDLRQASWVLIELVHF